MGEHKHNPKAIAAKNGELPPKPQKLSKREQDRLIMREIERITGINQIRKHLNGGYYG